MRMVTAEHVADSGRAFAVGLVAGQAVLVHSVEDAAVNRLEAVAHVRQGAANNDAHGVIDVGFSHLPVQIDRENLLVFVFLTHFSLQS